ncbi:MAG: DUF2066 domain-containing protein [Methylobacter sp.]|jgi:hypothetical protein
MSVLLRALIICGLLFSSNVFAAEVQGLYETEVIAKSQSEEDKNAALKEALTIVLTRVMAGENILHDPVVQSALADAGHFVKQYQYSLIESHSDENSNARIMRVLFNESHVLDLMKTSKLKIWAETRPETLLWLVVEENGQRSFFKAETMSEINKAVNGASRQTGLPLLFPLLDLEEQQKISVSDVLSAYPQSLLTASERYGVVSILAGRLVKTDDCWKTDWAFYFDEGIEQWTMPCGALNDAILTGMEGAYGRLSKYYAVKPDVIETSSVMLEVSGDKDANDRSRVIHYLNSLAMVKSVVWSGGEAGFSRYKVGFEGNRRALEELLGIGRVLDPQGGNSAGTGGLRYQLLPERFN